jgi:hypothetical protein
MKVTVAIETKQFSLVSMSANVETFRDVERLGRKLAMFAKNAARILPDLKESDVVSIKVSTEASARKRNRPKRRFAAQPAEAQS